MHRRFGDNPPPPSCMYEPRGCVHEVEIFTRYLVASAALRPEPKPRSNGMRNNAGAPPPPHRVTHRSAHPGPLSGGAGSRPAQPAQVEKRRPRPPPFVRMQRLACSGRCIHSCCRAKDHVDALAVADLCALAPACEQPGAQSSCRTSSSISWLPKDRQRELHEGSIESL
jgi:hypothetical protein